MNTEQQRHAVQTLERLGFIVIPPQGERTKHARSVHARKRPMQMRVLYAFQRKIESDAKIRLPREQHGYTDPEISELLEHPDLHRRTAELRNCGLLEAVEIDGKPVRRRGKVVWRISPAGMAAARSFARTSSALST